MGEGEDVSMGPGGSEWTPACGPRLRPTKEGKGKVESGETRASCDGNEITTWPEIWLEPGGSNGPDCGGVGPVGVESNKGGAARGGAGTGLGDIGGPKLVARRGVAGPKEEEPAGRPIRPGDDVIPLDAEGEATIVGRVVRPSHDSGRPRAAKRDPSAAVGVALARLVPALGGGGLRFR
ncbi:hypothetical protein K2173_004980 [Erythroxylum novogranatense]|uniref:Uncharacterized protein n=1 Tax=Erythroxylum novogranatense TaxID=1862640 RepID=A0AAV8TCS2_9ROSI|nr:hypothetical protein K2173_004980 [Erythroxylum novogranatense]